MRHRIKLSIIDAYYKDNDSVSKAEVVASLEVLRNILEDQINYYPGASIEFVNEMNSLFERRRR